jgi:hypothetical protein
MIAKTFEIMKARWPEVMLIWILQAAMMLLSIEMMHRWDIEETATAPPAPEWAIFFLAMGLAWLTIIWYMLLLGFLKTAAMEGATGQQPLTLLRAGRPYLWRMIGTQLLVGVGAWFIMGMMIAGYFLVTKQKDVSNPPAWLIEPAGAIAMLLLAKPFLLMPSFIVVLDLAIRNSFLQMMQVPLTRIADLLKPVMAGFTIITIIGVSASFVPQQGPLFYTAAGVNCLAKSLNLLVLLLTAVLWTAKVFLPPPVPIEEEK